MDNGIAMATKMALRLPKKKSKTVRPITLSYRQEIFQKQKGNGEMQNKAKDMISYSLKCQKISGILNKFEGMRFPPQIEKQKVSIDGKEIITV